MKFKMKRKMKLKIKKMIIKLNKVILEKKEDIVHYINRIKVLNNLKIQKRILI